MTKDSERYIDEWVDYNFAIGFHDIYIYDNSETNTLGQWGELSLPRNDRNVHVTHFPGRRTQELAYDDCARKFKNRSDYLAFFDDDEFLVLKKHSNVAELVQEHLHNGSLAIHWHVFGTSNHTTYAPLPVTKRFQFRKRDPCKPHALIKSIVRTQDYVRANTVHSFILKNGTYHKDTAGGMDLGVRGVVMKKCVSDVAVLHHYKYKSETEYHYKSCVRKGANGNKKNCNETPPIGDFFDDSAWQILKARVPKYAMFDDWVDVS